MQQYVVHEVAPDVVARIDRTMPALPSVVDREVERLWQAASERVAAGGAGQLFNGQVFSADSITPHLITGHLTEFRRIVAQMERPALELEVRPLAVCGTLRCADGVVVGRRHHAAIYQAGMWQLPPAGSVDASAVGADGVVDLRRQLLSELQEELGLAAGTVSEPEPLCIVEHPGSRVSDFGFGLITDLSGKAVLAAYRANGNPEYEEMRVVPEAKIAAFLAEAGGGLVWPAREFLMRAGLTIRVPDSSR